VYIQGEPFKDFVRRSPEFRNFFVTSRESIRSIPDEQRATLFTFLTRYHSIPGDAGQSETLNKLFETFGDMGGAKHFLVVELGGKVDQLPLPPGVTGSIDKNGSATLVYNFKNIEGTVQPGTDADPRHIFTLTGKNDLGLKFPSGQNSMPLIEVIEQIQLLNPNTLDRGMVNRAWKYLKDEPAFKESFNAPNVRPFDAYNLNDGVPGRIDTQMSAGMMRFPNLTADDINQLQSPNFKGMIYKEHNIAGTRVLAFHMKDTSYIQAIPPNMKASYTDGTLTVTDQSGKELVKGKLDLSVGIDITVNDKQRPLSDILSEQYTSLPK
jgi:hypothetical protein